MHIDSTALRVKLIPHIIKGAPFYIASDYRTLGPSFRLAHLRCESGIPATGKLKYHNLTSYKLPHTVGLANWQSD
jgi:hypothetical protein